MQPRDAFIFFYIYRPNICLIYTTRVIKRNQFYFRLVLLDIFLCYMY